MATISSQQQPRLQGQVQPCPMGNGTAAVVLITAVLALAAAVAGLVIDGVYTGARSTAEVLRGYDVVTAVLVTPALALAVGRARRGSLLGRLVTAGLLADLVYGYAFYVFATDFNDLFLLHVAVFSSSLIALVLTIGGLDLATVGEQFRGMRQVWPVAASLGVLAISLGGMWVAAAVVNELASYRPSAVELLELRCERPFPEVLVQVLEGPEALDARPVQLVRHARGAVRWLLDEAAASKLARRG